MAPMYDRSFHGLLWLAAALASLTHGFTKVSADDSSQVGQRPNIIFIFSDDHALQAIGAYGSQVNQTPRIDQLARQGMIFDQSFCCNSLCGPSRASVLTGKHSHVNGFMRNGNRFDGSQPTFIKRLQKTGYQTAVIGKWHLVSQPEGFDFYRILPGQGSYYNPDFIEMDGSRKRYEGYCTDLIADFSIDWLEQRDRDRPFVLMCQHKAPHRNWAPHPRHFGRYKLGTIPEPATLFDDYSGRTKLLHESEMSIANHFHWGHDMKFHGENRFPEHFRGAIKNGEYGRMTDQQKADWDAYYEPENQAFMKQLQAGQLTTEQVTQWKYQRYMHDYLGCVQAVDENVGRIIDYVDNSELADNTVVIYCSDQGFYLGEHGWYDKRWMFEESLRMPFLIRWPNVVPAGQRSQAMIQNIDYAPTFLEMAGVELPEDIQGESFLSILKSDGGVPEDWRQAIYYAYYENAAVHQVPQHDGVRTDRYKAMYFPRTREWNLFDLETDPQEMKSVHDQPQYKEVLEDMKQRYNQLRDKYEVNSATIPATRGDEAWWAKRDREKRQQAQQGGHDLVFIGDSITQGWEGAGRDIWQQHFGDVKALNLGFSGDRTEHVIWRLSQNQMGPNRPQVAVIMIGTNNAGHSQQDPAQTAAGVQEIVRLLRQKSPKTKILLQSIFPRGADPQDPLRQINSGVNEKISSLDDGQHVFFQDVSEAFLEPDGTISKEVMPDLLHLSAEGYRRWAETLLPKLQKWNVLRGQ